MSSTQYLVCITVGYIVTHDRIVLFLDIPQVLMTVFQ